MGQSLLVAENLAIGYGVQQRPRRIVARQLKLNLYAGELVCLLGPNGAGKSTLLRTLCGMLPPLQGQIRLLGEDLRQLHPLDIARQLSVVLTEQTDAGALSVYALVALGRYPYTDWSGRLTAIDEARVRQAIHAVGATALAQRPVNELSDGERQKVMIARALAQEPRVLLLDEPTAFLDLPRRVEIIGILGRLARETGQAVLLSTHDLDLALRSADKLWLLPQGGPLKIGVPEDLVLNGAFQSVFHSEGVEFDAYAGAFKLRRSIMGQVDLVGDGLAALWTTRALEREGFAVNRLGKPASTACIQIMNQAGQTIWRISHARKRYECHTLSQVLTYLKAQPADVFAHLDSASMVIKHA
jgi:iron complex transport system ATP-binding protein